MVLLLLLDGFGVAPAGEANVINADNMPFFTELAREYPVAVLTTAAQSLNTRYLTLGSGQEIIDEDIKPETTLSSTLAASNLKQLKIVETERLAVLTVFFNGGREERSVGEEYNIISSASGATSSQPFVTLTKAVKEITKAIAKEKFDFIVATIPYLDLVAASGDLFQAQKATEVLDKYLRTIVATAESKDCVVVISSAHGNVEHMKSMSTDLPDTERTSNPVPFLIIGREFSGKTIGLVDPISSDLSLLAPVGTLADIAPTVLKIMGLDVPPDMTGKRLLR